jgi:hypothetical protein
VNAPPAPNPPPFFGPGIAATTKFPLFSSGYGGVNTGISGDGVASAGTRIALVFTALDETVTVPNVIYLHVSASVVSGVMIATSTDPNGAGPFAPFLEPLPTFTTSAQWPMKFSTRIPSQSNPPMFPCR